MHFNLITFIIQQFAGTGTLYSGSYDGHVQVWSMETKRVVNKVSAHPGNSILYLDFIDDIHMLTHGRDGLVKIWTRMEESWMQDGKVLIKDL